MKFYNHISNRFYGDVDIEESYQYKNERNKTMNKSILTNRNPFSSKVAPLNDLQDSDQTLNRRLSDEGEWESEEEISRIFEHS